MVELSRHVGYVGLTRLPRIDPLKNSGNRLSFASSRSRSRFRDMSGKASTLRRTLHTARRPEIVRHCSRAFALLGWMLSVAAIVLAFHVVATSARFRAPPRSPSDRSCRGVLEPPSPGSLTHACRVSHAAGQSALLFVIMLALTPASSTPAPCPRAPFATLVTSRRRVHDRRRREALSSHGLPVRRLRLGSSCPSLHDVLLEISPVFVFLRILFAR